ncbi:MAG: cation-binding protein, partial [Bacteroidales bacterium]|nr:cation-binding protein [Bacteroidales bacterium]
MKTATQNLEDDHAFILQLTDVMELMVNQQTKSIQDIETVLSLIRNYADGFHHAKEENLLFPLMTQKG